MDRRTLIFAAIAAGLCGCAPRTTTVVCDPDLAPALDRALRTRGAKLYVLAPEPPKGLLATAAGGRLIVTREPKLADRIQRQGEARLQNRWTATVSGGPVVILATTGEGEADAARLGKWLASEEAAELLGP